MVGIARCGCEWIYIVAKLEALWRPGYSMMSVAKTILGAWGIYAYLHCNAARESGHARLNFWQIMVKHTHCAEWKWSTPCYQKYQATQPYQSIRGKDLSANMIGRQNRKGKKKPREPPRVRTRELCTLLLDNVITSRWAPGLGQRSR